MSNPDHHAEMEEHVTYGKRIQELHADLQQVHGFLEIERRTSSELRTQLTEAAAFLDALAARFDNAIEPTEWIADGISAADCRAMAKKLRKVK